MKAWGIFVSILILSGLSAPRCGATVYHSDGTAANVQTIHDNQAQNGDTITLPTGTFTWATRVNISKGIILQGNGVGNTIIRDNVQSGQLIHWSLPAGTDSRRTGIEFQDGGRVNEAAAPGGIFHVDGSNTNDATFRFDNSKWNNLNGVPVFDTVIGVIDHNTFVQDRNQTAIYIYDSNWDGRSYGDGSWVAPTGFGSSQFLFIEDNNFTHTSASTTLVTDAHAGSRFVVRHNTIFNAYVGNHGTESTGRVRGNRALEVYNNIYTGTNLNRFIGGTRSGVVLFHDNNISGFWNPPVFSLVNYRNRWAFASWGGADGTNVWDINSGPFFTGTAAANSVGTTVTVSGANWTANQWVGYTIRRALGGFSWITSNTSNTISYADSGGFGNNLSFSAGDALSIYKVNQALDQPGRARGSLITGDTPVRRPGCNDQVTEPCYSWNNLSGTTPVNFETEVMIRAGEHYFNDTPMPGYTPYVYPHPLTKALGPPEQTTRNTTANSQHDAYKKRRPWGGKKPERKQAKKAKESPKNEMAEGQEKIGGD